MKLFSQILAASLSLMVAANGFACSPDGKSGFLPENDMRIPVDAKNNKGINQEQFNGVITRISDLYAPVVAAQGGKLVVNRKWTDETVNASAQQQGRNWVVNMYGGLARHSAVTEDGFALVMCHEVGHHLAGAPKIKILFGLLGKWASNEGQSDYFATLKCLRKLFLNDDNAAIIANMNVPAAVTAKCEASFPTEADKNICIRGAMAGLSVASLFKDLRNESQTLDFSSPDRSVVRRTDNDHPATQCRLDTYLAGALCDVDMNTDVSNNDERTGTCHAANGDTNGLRPLCWFKPKAF